MEKYVNSRYLFFRHLRRRYGRRADELIRSTTRSYANWLSHQGLLAMQQGNSAAARVYFARILRHQPAHLKSALRWLRTFLPAPIARALSGRTAGAKPRLLIQGASPSQGALAEAERANESARCACQKGIEGEDHYSVAPALAGGLLQSGTQAKACATKK
jgi:hypothetical protein